MVERSDALQGMLEPQPRLRDHLRWLAEIRDDRIVRTVNSEKAKATECSAQANRSNHRQGAPKPSSVGSRYHCVVTRSNHGARPSRWQLQRWASRLGVIEPRRVPPHD